MATSSLRLLFHLQRDNILRSLLVLLVSQFRDMVVMGLEYFLEDLDESFS